MDNDHHLEHEEEERKEKEDELQLLAVAAENKFLMKIMAQSILKTDKVEDLFVDPAKDFKFMTDLNNTNT